MTDPGPAGDFAWRALLVRSAAYAALESSKRAALLRFMSDSTSSVVYVFDTNTVVGFCAPWRDETDASPTSIGQILPPRPTYHRSTVDHLRIRREEAERAEAVSKLIMRQCLRARSTDRSGYPVYQLPTHFRETVERYEWVRKRAEFFSSTTGKAVVDRASSFDLRLLALLRNMISGELHESSAIDAVALNIAHRIMSRSKSDNRTVREWDSFYTLNVRGGGVFSTADFVWPMSRGGRKADTDIAIEQAIKMPAKGEEIEAQKALTDEIFEEISHVRFNKTLNIETDARAVADLFLINRRLKRISSKCRVVLITGDRSLTHGLFEGLTPDARRAHALDTDLAARIGRDHIHHPWSFVDDIANLTGARLDTGATPLLGKSEFFSGLLAFREEAVPERLTDDWKEKSWDIRQDQLNEIYLGKKWQNLSEIEDSTIQLAYEHWQSFTRQAVQADALEEIGEAAGPNANDVRIAIINVVKKSTRRETFDWTSLQQEVEEVVLRARDRSNVVFSDIGADVLMAAKQSGTRNPPDLMFDTVTNSNLIFERLSDPKVIYNTVQNFNEDFDRIKLDCHDSLEDQDDRLEIHLKYLVLGALVASAERWSVAEEHAKNAIGIVERARRTGSKIPVKAGSGTNVSGREGYFLRAVARRVRAVDQADILRARMYLETARTRLQEDRDAGSGMGIPWIRFDNEDLAVALSSYYITRMSNQKSNCNREFADIAKRARNVIGRRAEMKDNEEIEGAVRGDRYSAIRPGTKVAVAINLIQALVVWTYRRRRGLSVEEPPISDAGLREALEDVYRNCDIENKLPEHAFCGYRRGIEEVPKSICSALIVRYASVGAQLLKDDRFWFFRSSDDVDRLFASDSNATTYDAWRFPMLKKFALESLD